MKRSSIARHPLVVTKNKRTATATGTAAPPAVRRATPDRGRIRGYIPDDTERQDQERFSRRPEREQLQEVIAAWCGEVGMGHQGRVTARRHVRLYRATRRERRRRLRTRVLR
jgi:hypothetical protein